MITQAARNSFTAPVQDNAANHGPSQETAAQASLLPAPDYVATDPTAMIAKLLVKSSQQKREGDEQSIRGEEAREDAADARRIEAMKSKADRTMLAGIASGGSQLASGLGSFGGGVAGASAPTGPGGADAARFSSMKWEGAGGVAGATGKLAEAGLKSEADHFDRKIVDAESGAKQCKRAQDQLRRQIDAGTQHEGKVMQLLQEIEQGQAQCARAALLRMA